MILLDAGERLVAAFSEKLSGKVAEQLKERRRDGARGRARHRDRRRRRDDRGGRQSERIDARTVVWAAGVHSVAPRRTPSRAPPARAAIAGGRIEVDPDLTRARASRGLGDRRRRLPGGTGGAPAAGPRDGRDPAGAPRRQGDRRRRSRAPATPFHYFDKGALAVVGRGKAVCEIRGHELSGRLAFFTYLSVHMYYLGRRSRPAHRRC